MADPVAAQVRAHAQSASDLLLAPESERVDAYAAAVAAIACSGTVTSELALAGVPSVVGYRMDWISSVLVRMLLRTPYISLVNIAAGRALVPELLQEKCVGRHLAEAAEPFLADPEAARKRGAELRAAALQLKGEAGDPAVAAARAILAEIGVPVRTGR